MAAAVVMKRVNWPAPKDKMILFAGAFDAGEIGPVMVHVLLPAESFAEFGEPLDFEIRLRSHTTT